MRIALATTARSSVPDLAEQLRELVPPLLFPCRSEGPRELLTRYVQEIHARRGREAAV